MNIFVLSMTELVLNMTGSVDNNNHDDDNPHVDLRTDENRL